MIPECTHPLSKHWDQPKNTDIEVDDLYALMSQQSFEELKEYSCTIPTGVYAGKMWKAHNRLNGNWYLRWYEDTKIDDGMCLVKSKVILIA